MSIASSVHNDVSGYLSLSIFLQGSPSDRNIILTTFLFAASSGISPNNAFTLGFVSTADLVNSFMEIEYLAIIATANRLTHSSHFIPGVFDASCQNSGNPTSKELVVVEFAECDDDDDDVRSAKLQCLDKKQLFYG